MISIKPWKVSALFFLLFSVSLSSQTTDVYVSAHPDDWQLFMNPNAAKSLRDSTKTVIFIHTTAGDAGLGTGENEYYKAREEGSLRSIRFLVNILKGNNNLAMQMKEDLVNLNGHSILRYSFGNAQAYFFRLPDGNPRGEGYELHQFQSLERLYNGEVSQISAIDQTATYHSLRELKDTFKALFDQSGVQGGRLNFNLSETDTLINPGDHSDHRYSSTILQEVLREIPADSLTLYQQYCTNKNLPNIKDVPLMINIGTWGVTASGLSDMGHYTTWDNAHNSWLDKQYFRIIPLKGEKEKER